MISTVGRFAELANRFAKSNRVISIHFSVRMISTTQMPSALHDSWNAGVNSNAKEIYQSSLLCDCQTITRMAQGSVSLHPLRWSLRMMLLLAHWSKEFPKVRPGTRQSSSSLKTMRKTALIMWMLTVDSTLYSTASMLRTMGLILGLEPMTQFDASANPMYQSFHLRPDFSTYRALPANVDVNAVNLSSAWGAKQSEQLDFTKEDSADDLVLGDIVWRSVKGADSPMPAPVRSAFVFSASSKDDKDDDHVDDAEK